MNRPTLESLVEAAQGLADDLDRIVGAVPQPVVGRDLSRRVAVLEAQVAALRAMQPTADGFLPVRLTWSMGQSVAVVLPAALRRLESVGFVTGTEVDRCLDQSVALAAALQVYETT